jgi:hypothetical protein
VIAFRADARCASSPRVTDTLTGLSFGSNTRSAFIGGGQVGFTIKSAPSSFSVPKGSSMGSQATTTPALVLSFRASA